MHGSLDPKNTTLIHRRFSQYGSGPHIIGSCTEIHDVPLSLLSLSLFIFQYYIKSHIDNIQTMSSDLKPIHPEVMYAERSSTTEPEKVGFDINVKELSLITFFSIFNYFIPNRMLSTSLLVLLISKENLSLRSSPSRSTSLPSLESGLSFVLRIEMQLMV